MIKLYRFALTYAAYVFSLYKRSEVLLLRQVMYEIFNTFHLYFLFATKSNVFVAMIRGLHTS